MDRAQILSEMGIDTWIRRGRKLADSVKSEMDVIAQEKSSQPANPHETGPSDAAGPSEPIAGVSKQGPLAEATDRRVPTSKRGMEALANASTADSMEDLRSEVIACQRCPLYKTRTRAVPGIGNPSAKWLFVGKAPGVEEDRKGEPFVGRAGQLLDNILRALGVGRQDVYISSVLKCHPPGNRDLKSKEIDNCRSFLSRELIMVQPDVVIALGDAAMRELLKNDMPIDNLRGKVHRLAGTDIPCIVTYHPASVLRDPTQKKSVWDDLLLAKSLITEDSEPIISASAGN